MADIPRFWNTLDAGQTSRAGSKRNCAYARPALAKPPFAKPMFAKTIFAQQCLIARITRFG